MDLQEYEYFIVVMNVSLKMDQVIIMIIWFNVCVSVLCGGVNVEWVILDLEVARNFGIMEVGKVKL